MARLKQELTPEKKRAIRDAIQMKELTQAELARRIDWQEGSLSRFLRDQKGARYIKTERLRALCLALDLNPADFVLQTDLLLDRDLVARFQRGLEEVEKQLDDGNSRVVAIIGIYGNPNHHHEVIKKRYPLNKRARWPREHRQP
jgi:transcriptional regulator with XRE-family HTH domain